MGIFVILCLLGGELANNENNEDEPSNKYIWDAGNNRVYYVDNIYEKITKQISIMSFDVCYDRDDSTEEEYRFMV